MVIDAALRRCAGRATAIMLDPDSADRTAAIGMAGLA